MFEVETRKHPKNTVSDGVPTATRPARGRQFANEHAITTKTAENSSSSNLEIVKLELKGIDDWSHAEADYNRRLNRSSKDLREALELNR